MLTGSDNDKRRAQWVAVAAFTALSLPMVFVGERTEVSLATGNPLSSFAPVITPAQAPSVPGGGPSNLAPKKAPVTRKRIVISIPERKLAVVDQGRVTKTYPVAVGAGVSPSPTGEFKIINKITNPTYYRKGKVIGPGGENPLGSRWLGLDREHYGIHGTNEPQSIGAAASHGCIRMATADVEELFTVARVGDRVEISGSALGELAQLDEASGGAGGK